MADFPENARKLLHPGEKPTLRTIARISGMAVTTVSRALGDAPDIGADTKDRLRRIADEIGYVPNRAGVRLRTGRTNVISLVVTADHDIMNVTSRLLTSIATGLRGSPFHLVMTPDFPDGDRMGPIRHIVEGRLADAIIINQTQPQDPRVAYLLEQGFPFVTHGRTIWADRHAWFDFDNEAFGRIAVEKLTERGARNLLMLAPPTDQFYAKEMIRGARLAAADAGVKLVLLSEITIDSSHDAVIEGIKSALSTMPDSDALISASPNSTMAAVSAIEAMGHTVGRDFDVFSKETVPFLRLFRDGILTLAEDVEEAGRFIARAAIAEALRKTDRPMQCLASPGNDHAHPL